MPTDEQIRKIMEEGRYEVIDYVLEDKKQVHILNTLLAKEKILDSGFSFANFNQQTKDQLPKGAVVTKKGFIVLEGENPADVDEKYFFFRDEFAVEMQKVSGVDAPLTEEQVREAYAQLQKAYADATQIYRLADARADALASDVRVGEERLVALEKELAKAKKDIAEINDRSAEERAEVARLESLLDEVRVALQNTGGFGGNRRAINKALGLLGS